MKKLLAILLCTIMVFALIPATAFADGTGDFTITPGQGGSGYAYLPESHTLRIMTTSEFSISGTTLADKIIVDKGVTAKITLNGLHIDLSAAGGCPIYLDDGANVTLILRDGTENTLTSGGNDSGIRTTNSTLTIQGTGKLTVFAGTNGSHDCAGIGGGKEENYGSITIDNGTVEASGDYNGAGIGGGYKSTGGSIVINGGTVTGNGSPTNSNGGAGIGGGYAGSAGDITINDGTVHANGGLSMGAAIGSGGYGSSGYTVTIKGGTVTAEGKYGAAIGSGGHAHGGTITVEGGSVTATGTDGGAGIGGSSECTVNISGGTVTAEGKSGWNSGIGASGTSDEGYRDGCTVNISGGTVAASGYTGIGGGYLGRGGDVTITGGTVTATASASNGSGAGAGIGGGGAGGNVKISGGTVKATSIGSDTQPIGHGAQSSDSGTLTNGSNQHVYLTTVTLADARGTAKGALAVSSLTAALSGSAYTYGITDVKSDADGKLYLYLPSGTGVTAVKTTDGGSPAVYSDYYGSVSTASTDSTGELRLASKPVIDDTTPLADATIGTAYSQAIAHIGTEPITWSLSVGSSLPDGLILDDKSGVISGTPTVAATTGTSTFTVKAVNEQGSEEKQLSINVKRPDIVITSDEFNAAADESFKEKLAATGLDTITWSQTAGTLPQGVTLAKDGTLSGKLTTAGVYTFTVQAANGTDKPVTQSITVYVSPVITPDSLPNGKVGEAYNQKLSVNGNIISPMWVLARGSVLPDGLTLDQDTGVISGTPKEAGDDFDLYIYVSNDDLAKDEIFGYIHLTLEVDAVITATSSNTVYGTVSGGGTYQKDDPVTLTAVPNSGCIFVRWLEDGKTVSTNAKYTFTATTSRTLKAEFVKSDTPLVTAVSAGSNSTKLTWSALSSASAYEVYRSASAGGAYTLLVKTASAGYTDTGLSCGSTYYYKVRAVYGQTYGEYSAMVSAKPMPGATTVSVQSVGYNSVKLAWNAVPGTVKYAVYRSTAKNGAYTQLTETTATAYTASGLTTGKTYYFKVCAYCLVGKTKVYGGSAIVTVKPLPGTPSSVKATRASSKSIKISWGSVSGATKYSVYRSTSKNGKYTVVTETASKSYTNAKLTKGKTYYYKVSAYRLVGKTKVYGSTSAIVSAKP